MVGGTNAEESEFPFIVSLTRRGGHFCGASIVNDKWIMTAGHCVCKYVINLVFDCVIEISNSLKKKFFQLTVV